MDFSRQNNRGLVRCKVVHFERAFSKIKAEQGVNLLARVPVREGGDVSCETDLIERTMFSLFSNVYFRAIIYENQ